MAIEVLEGLAAGSVCGGIGLLALTITSLHGITVYSVFRHAGQQQEVRPRRVQMSLQASQFVRVMTTSLCMLAATHLQAQACSIVHEHMHTGKGL